MSMLTHGGRWTPGRFAWARPLALFVVLSASPAALAADTSLRLASEPGEYVGNGQNLIFTPADGTFSVLFHPAEGARFRFETPGRAKTWDLEFMTAQRVPLTVGMYRDAWPAFWTDSQPGFSVGGEHRGCGGRGSFQVKEVSYAASGEPNAFWVVFEQRCEHQRAALRGDLRFNAEVVVALTAPLGQIVDKDTLLSFAVSATDIDGRHVALTAESLPSDAVFTDHGDNTGTFSWTPGFDRFGNFDVSFRADNGAGGIDESTTRIVVLGTTSLFIDSEPGDPTGEGEVAFLAATDGLFRVEKNSETGVTTRLIFPTFSKPWQLNFSAPYSGPLQVGTYTGAARYPGQDPAAPGLLAYGGGEICDPLTGEFEVKQIEYGPVTDVSSYWATFEQYCEGAAAALRGEIRINADVPVLIAAPDLSFVGEDHELSLDVSARNKADGPVALRASDLPSGASFTDNGNSTGTLTWVPSVGQVGRYTVRLTAENAQGEVDRAATRIRVRIKNDDFNDAIPFSGLPFEDVRDTRLATHGTTDPSFDPDCLGFGVQSVWYAFQPARAVEVLATADGYGYPPKLAVYIGSEGALQKIACDEGAIRFTASAVHTYYFLVEGGGDLTFKVEQASTTQPRPSNDDIRDATRITAMPFVDAVDTSGATINRDDPSSCGGGTRTVWYALTARDHALVDVSTAGSDYAASVSVWTGSRGALRRVACGHSSLTFEGRKGRTYYLMVEADAVEAPAVLRLAVDARLLLDLGVSLDPSGSYHRETGETSIRGRVSCSKPAVIAVHGVIRPRSGRNSSVETPFELSIPCAGTTAWTAVTAGVPGQGPGPASVTVDASAVDDVTGDMVHARTTARTLMRIRR